MNKILTVWKKELKDTIRDRRTLAVAIFMPIVLMPLILVGSFKLQESQLESAQNKTVVLSVINSQSAPQLTEYLNSQDKLEIKEGIDNYQQAIENGEIYATVILPEDYQAKLSGNQAVEIKLVGKSTEYNSELAAQKITGLLNAYNDILTQQKLSQAGVDSQIMHNLQVISEDLATSQEKGGFFLGLLLPMFLVLFSIIGGMYMAIDISAGEKERKTLEALLLVPLSRLQIVTGKFLAVATTSITTVVLSILSMYVSFIIWPPNLGTELSGLEFNLTGSTILIMIGIGILLSVMFAALLLAVAIFAKSYKEAQNYVMPLYLLVVLPVSLLGSLPGFKPPFFFFFIPAVNAVILFKEILLDNFVFSHIVVTFASLLLFASISILIAAKIYGKENILFRD